MARPQERQDRPRPPSKGPGVRGRGDEAQLVRAAREGCSASFAALVQRYSRPLLSFLTARLGDRHLAEDLAQETFVRVYRNLDRYRSEAKFSTWLFTIAANLAASHGRRVRRRPTQEPLGTVASQRPGPVQVIARREQEQSLWAAVSELPELQRQAVELRYLAQLSVNEAAGVLGKTPVHVKVILYRARRNLARKLAMRNETIGPSRAVTRSDLAGQGVLP